MEIKIFRYAVTDSTNERARDYARSGGEMPALFIAEGQSAGRGRKGRSFNSAVGGGLYATLLFEPSGSDAVLITVRAAVAMAKAIKKTADLDVKIKWVNDLVVGKRKLAGILAEGDLMPDGSLSYCALGVGVNLADRAFPDELKNAVTTVEGETGKKIDAQTLAEEFVSEFFEISENAYIIGEYRRLSAVIGERVEARRISGEVFLCDVLDISDTGALVVRKDDRTTEELISAEVSIVRN